MFRSILTGHLTLSALAGPSLCCCMLSRLGIGSCEDRQPAAEKAHAATHGCCCHHKPSEPAKSQQCPSDRPSCPCQKEGGLLALSLVPRTELANLIDFHDAAPDHSVFAVEPVLLTCEAADQIRLFDQSLFSVLPSARAILRAHTLLRC